jgi:hypothetical protein
VDFTSAYFHVMDMPDEGGLHALWNSATLNMTLYTDTVDPTAPPIISMSMLSLWDACNVILVSIIYNM